jgi:hypothetical protein
LLEKRTYPDVDGEEGVALERDAGPCHGAALHRVQGEDEGVVHHRARWRHQRWCRAQGSSTNNEMFKGCLTRLKGATIGMIKSISMRELPIVYYKASWIFISKFKFFRGIEKRLSFV